MIQEALTYNDVLLVPQYSDIVSRKEVDLTSWLSDHQFRLPIIASPMDTISETKMAKESSSLLFKPFLCFLPFFLFFTRNVFSDFSHTNLKNSLYCSFRLS